MRARIQETLYSITPRSITQTSRSFLKTLGEPDAMFTLIGLFVVFISFVASSRGSGGIPMGPDSLLIHCVAGMVCVGIWVREMWIPEKSGFFSVLYLCAILLLFPFSSGYLLLQKDCSVLSVMILLFSSSMVALMLETISACILFGLGMSLAFVCFHAFNGLQVDVWSGEFVAWIAYGMFFSLFLSGFAFRVRSARYEEKIEFLCDQIVQLNEVPHSLYLELKEVTHKMSQVARDNQEANHELARRYRQLLRSQEIKPTHEDFHVMGASCVGSAKIIKTGHKMIELIELIKLQKSRPKAQLIHVGEQVVNLLNSGKLRRYLTQNISWEDRYPFESSAHPRLLAYLLNNLIENTHFALFWAEMILRRKGSVRIWTESCSDPLYAGKLCIEDDGIGIPEKDMTALFNPHFVGQIYGKNAFSPESTGMGLYLCRRALSKLGGRIECDSKHNEFTRFSIFLPKELAS